MKRTGENQISGQNPPLIISRLVALRHDRVRQIVAKSVEIKWLLDRIKKSWTLFSHAAQGCSVLPARPHIDRCRTSGLVSDMYFLLGGAEK